MSKEYGMKYFWLLFFGLILVLAACPSSPAFDQYRGESLHIAVVGELPEVKEKQIKWVEVSLDDLIAEELHSYDAVIITENNLFEAAEPKYANVYLNSAIPFFFIGTYNYLPFTEKDLAYNKSWNWTAGNSYAVGVLPLHKNDSLKHQEYGLYNDKKTDEHIADMYSRIFKTINDLDQ